LDDRIIEQINQLGDRKIVSVDHNISNQALTTEAVDADLAFSGARV